MNKMHEDILEFMASNNDYISTTDLFNGLGLEINRGSFYEELTKMELRNLIERSHGVEENKHTLCFKWNRIIIGE